jgi:hypothetical protein
VLLVAAALVLGATGCGGGDKSSEPPAGSPTVSTGFTPYELQMQRLGQQLGAALMSLGAANKTAEAPVILRDLRQAQKELRTAAGKLSKITPPAKIKAQHQLLIKGVRDYANEIDTVIAKFKSGSREAVFSVGSLNGVKEMQKASVAISKAGYVIALG